MRCVSINAVINADTNRWHVLVYNVLWLYLFIMSFSENKNALKLGMTCFVFDILKFEFFCLFKIKKQTKMH